MFTNILESFVFDNNFKFIAKGNEKELFKKYGKLKEPEEKDIIKILPFFKNYEFFPEFYQKNIEITKKAIKESVKKDVLIIQTINNIEGIDKVNSILIKNLREWYEIYNPEFSKSISNNEKFTELIIKKNKKGLLKEIKVREEDSMGADLSKDDLDAIKELAKKLDGIYNLKKGQQEYLEKLMREECPNLTEIASVFIGAKLIAYAGSLKRLSEMPASTIQLLGAEKALFRHMRTGAKAPKYGILFQHPLIGKINKKNYGKVARALADKISIAAKVDYFKGDFIGDKLKKEVEARFK